MALTQVRAKLGGTWVALTYNEATGRYEGQLTPSGTSIHQPGGYFPITVEATNDSGDTATATADTMNSLRLVVRETTAPTLTLVSPAPGYLQTGTPTFVFDATDEAGGSGVDPDTFSLEGATAEEITGGYRFTWTPPGGWSDGAHTVTASVADYDGNEASVSGAYTVDTVPPVLYITAPYMRHVVDVETVTVAVEVSDSGSGVASVTIGGQAVTGSGSYQRTVPLSVGENTIPIVATDTAGNQTTGSVYMIRLITDRTRGDVAVLEDLYSRPGEWTEAELEWFNTAIVKGAYNAEDLNRVGVAVRWLAQELTRRGYLSSVQTKTDWTGTDAPTIPQMDDYLQNVEAVRSAQGLYVPDIPASMRRSTVEDWNKIEKALVETDSYFPNYFAWSSGEISCGE